MLGITTDLYNSMIFSTLNSSHGFAFDFSKRPHMDRNVFLTYKSMINP